MSPREKAKRKKVSFAGDAHDVEKAAVGNAAGDAPFTDITMSTASNKIGPSLDLKTIDPLIVPGLIEQYFIRLVGMLPGREESDLLMDWLTFECEEENSAVSDFTLYVSQTASLLILL